MPCNQLFALTRTYLWVGRKKVDLCLLRKSTKVASCACSRAYPSSVELLIGTRYGSLAQRRSRCSPPYKVLGIMPSAKTYTKLNFSPQPCETLLQRQQEKGQWKDFSAPSVYYMHSGWQERISVTNWWKLLAMLGMSPVYILPVHGRKVSSGVRPYRNMS